MKRRNTGVILTIAIMLFGLTACQKTEDASADDSGQTEAAVSQTMDETVQTADGSSEELPQESGTGQEMTQQGDISLLKPLTDSPEYQACMEWENFWEEYDKDGTILAQVGDEPNEEGYEYEAYNCYSTEMEEKIEEICAKYGLSKLSGFQILDDYDELCGKAGLGDFCIRSSENVKQDIMDCYMYDDGTFFMEGTAVIAGSSVFEASYQFSRVAKGSFVSAYLNIGDIAQYSVQEYTTQKGQKVYFAGGEDTNVHIIVEREKSFVAINVLLDMSDITGVNDERLQALADAFDFAAIP